LDKSEGSVRHSILGLKTKKNWEERSLHMIIIGCDHHPSFQQIAWVDTETGEIQERKLMHPGDEAEGFYRELKGPVRVGLESTGNCHWFVDLLAEMGYEVWIGDAARISAKQVRQQRTDRRDACHTLDLLVKDDFPRIWTPSKQERDHRQLLIHRYKLVTLRVRVKNELQHLAINQGMQKGRSLWSREGQKRLLELPLAFWAGTRRQDLLELLEKLNQQITALDQAVKKAAEENEKARLLMTQPGVGPITSLALVLTIGDATRFHRGKQVASYSGADPARVQFGRQATAGRNQQTRQSFSENAAGGSSPDGGSVRSQVSQGVYASLSSQAESCGQGGSGTQVGHTTLLDASRTHRRGL
jgi:transposase